MADDNEDPKEAAAKAKLNEQLDILKQQLKTREKILDKIKESGIEQDKIADKAITAAVEQEILQEKLRKLEVEKRKVARSGAEENAIKEVLEDMVKQANLLKDEIASKKELVKLADDYKKSKPAEGLQEEIDKRKEALHQLKDHVKAGKELGSIFEGLAGKFDAASQRGGKLSGALGNMSKASSSLGSSLSGGGLDKFIKGLDKLSDIPVIGKHFQKLSQGAKMLQSLPKVAENVRKFGKSLQMLKGVKGLGWLARLGPMIAGLGTGPIIAIIAVVAAIVLLTAEVFKLGDEVDTTSKAIGKATGFANDFHNQLVVSQQATVAAGIGMKELQEASISLATGFSKFDQQNDQTNASLMTTVSLLTKLGVSSTEAVKAMDHFSRAMGMSDQAAADMTAELALLGKEMGVTAQKMVSDFSGASGRLAMYGNDNIKVFKELEAQIKATGLEMNTMLGISQQYDSFDKAAESAAKLNSVLGTQLSSLELLNATDSERITMIRQQVKLSVGGNFDSLDKFTKLHIAEAMGLKDVAEAQRLLNMEQSEYNKYIGATGKGIEDPQGGLADMAESYVTLSESMGNFFRQIMYSMGPQIEKMSLVIKELAARIVAFGKSLAESQLIQSMFGGLVTATTIIIGKISDAIWILTKILDGFNFVMTPVRNAINGVVDSFLGLFDVLHLSGSPMLYMMPEYMTKAFTLMGDAAAWLGNKLMLPVRALSALWDIFHKPGSDMLYELPNYFGRALDAVSAAAATLGNVLMFPVKALSFLWDIFHKPGSDMLYELPNYFASALGAVSGAAKILGGILLSPVSMLQSFAEGFMTVKDNIGQIVGDMTGLLTVINEFASLDFDGFIAVRSDGSSTSMVMGSEGIIKQMSEGKLEVDINMPEIKLPEINIEVVFMDEKLTGIIDARIAEKVGGAG
jgi:hypothetical protein